MSAEHVSLYNGVSVPLLGLGTSHNNGGYVHETVLYAIKECQYRLIDTAQRYGCEGQLGDALQESGVDREDIFLTTKLWTGNYGYKSALEETNTSMKKLQTEYLDLYLLHWPGASSTQEMEETWRAMELLLDSGKCRAIGVSNFQERHLSRLLDYASIVPHVNQIEYHPYQNDAPLHTFCKDHKIQVMGYSPLGKGSCLSAPSVVSISSQVAKSPSQVLIRWSVQNGVITIPKSTKSHRVLQNCQVWDFSLSPEQMHTLDNMHTNMRVTWDPSNIP